MPSKVLPKSMPKPFHNRLYLDCPLGNPKDPNLDAKTPPRWTPKIALFFKKSVKNCYYSGLWFMLLLGSLQEPPKSLPRASQEPAKRVPGGVQALRRHPRAPRKLPCSKMRPKRPPISIKNSAILLATSVQMLRGRR